MSNQVLFPLNESSITIDMTPPIRRVAADISLSIATDYISSNEEINVNMNLSRLSVSTKKRKKLLIILLNNQ